MKILHLFSHSSNNFYACVRKDWGKEFFQLAEKCVQFFLSVCKDDTNQTPPKLVIYT